MNATNRDAIVSYHTLRKAIGWLGMLLPFLLLIGNSILNKMDVMNRAFFVNQELYPTFYTPDGSFKSSVSHYYYSTVGVLFTGTLITVGVFMFCYHGYKQRKGEKGFSDRFVTNSAGFFALGVALFPASSDKCINDNVHTFISSNIIGNIHFTFATLFFISLSIMCIVNFRRTGTPETFGTRPSHKFYLMCGVGMLSCLVLIATYALLLKGKSDFLDSLHPVFCLEALSLILFGVSWLMKGKLDLLYIPKKLTNKKIST